MRFIERMSAVLPAVVATGMILSPIGGWAVVSREEVARIADEVIQRPTELLDGVGTVHQTVTTDSDEAQAFYDQGLGWLHSYFWIEAARSFNQALRLDPNLAMAEVGMANAYRNMNLSKRAKSHLDRAVALASHASEREQLFIDARVLQWEAIYGPTKERMNKHRAYKAALASLIARYPGDAEAWVARGNAEERAAWGRGQLAGINAAAWYEGALARQPNHAGAHHYLLHAYENLRQYELAVQEGEAYANDAVLAPHAQHMLGHVLPRVGRWDDAVRQFEKADALERAYVERERVPAFVDWHHLHNLRLLGMAYLRQGRIDDAGRVLKEAFDLPGQNEGEEVFAHASYLEFLIQTGRFEDAIQAADEYRASHGAAGELVGAALKGEALLFLNKTSDAEAIADELRTRLTALDSGEGGTYAVTRARSFVTQYLAEVALSSEDPGMLYSARQPLVNIADGLLREAGFDGWGEGLFRMERMARLARRVGFDSLVDELTERMKRLDPTYVPRLDAP